MRALTIACDGQIEVVDAEANDYRWLRGIVGGNIEAVDLEPDVTLYLNEEGKLVGLPLNPLASRLAHHHGAIYSDDDVRGPVAIVGFDRSTGDSVELPEQVAVEAVRVMLDPNVPPVRVAPAFWESVAESVYAGIPVVAAIPPDAYDEEPPGVRTCPRCCFSASQTFTVCPARCGFRVTS